MSDKVKITAWFDKEVVEGFKALAEKTPGAKYQAMMNDVLRRHIDADPKDIEARVARLERMYSKNKGVL